MDVLEK